jgi:hypothetical protein
MLIKVLVKECTSIVHSSGIYKVVKGFAEVPQDISTELLEFSTRYEPVTEEVDKKIVSELRGEKEEKKVPDAPNSKAPAKAPKALKKPTKPKEEDKTPEHQG